MGKCLLTGLISSNNKFTIYIYLSILLTINHKERRYCYDLENPLIILLLVI